MNEQVRSDKNDENIIARINYVKGANVLAEVQKAMKNAAKCHEEVEVEDVLVDGAVKGQAVHGVLQREIALLDLPPLENAAVHGVCSNIRRIHTKYARRIVGMETRNDFRQSMRLRVKYDSQHRWNY